MAHLCSEIVLDNKMASLWVEEARLQSTHAVRVHLYDILEKGKSWDEKWVGEGVNEEFGGEVMDIF